MQTNKFGTMIPDTEQEFWKLYHNFQVTFIAMLDPNGFKIEIASYDVVKKLLCGYSFDVPQKRVAVFGETFVQDKMFDEQEFFDCCGVHASEHGGGLIC